MNTLERKELEELKRKTSPLRIKKPKPDVNEGCVSINDSVYAHNKDFNSVRNSYNYIMQNPQDRENISLHSNQNYARTQKYVPGNVNESKYESQIHCQSAKNASRFIDESSVHKNYDKVRMLDSHMTEEELYLEQEEQSTADKKGKSNIRANNQIFPNSLLNNSYDDIKQRDRAKTKKKAMATHRKELGQSVNITKNSSRNSRTHRKQRSISMRSTRNKPSILRASRNISDTLTEKSYSQRGGDRSLSMSLRHEK